MEKEKTVSDFGTGKADKLNISVKMTGGSNVPGRIEKEEETLKYTGYTTFRPNCYRAVGKFWSGLTPGVYVARRDYSGNIGSYFEELKVQIDELVAPKGGILDQILKDIDDFWKKEDVFKKYGFTYYRGYLFYGAHGGGKTCLVNLISKNIIGNGGLVLICKSPDEFIDCVKLIREVEPDRKIVCVFEDIEAMIKEYGEDQILAYLDGEQKISNVLNIATTNYPELLDKRLVSRPRRFDRVIKIDYPDEELRTSYLKTKIDKSEIKEWVKKTEGLSFAGLAELVISVKCLDKPFDETMQVLKDLQERQRSSEEYRSRVGFEGMNKKDEDD